MPTPAPPGHSDEHLSTSAQSRHSVYQSRQVAPQSRQPEHQYRQSSLQSRQSDYQSRQPNDHLSAFSQFSSIVPSSTTPGPKSNIAPVSSTRLATAGSLVHSLLYGSSSSPHSPQRCAISLTPPTTHDSISSPSVKGQMGAFKPLITHPKDTTTLIGSSSFLPNDFILAFSDSCHLPQSHLLASIFSHLQGLYGLWRKTEPDLYHQNLFRSLQDEVLWFAFESKLERNAMPHDAELSIYDPVHKTILTLLRLTVNVSPHMSGRSLRFASYFWVDVIIMHATLLFNLSWKLH